MSFVSLEFIIFVIASLALYYLMPLKIRWIALLIMSYAFYLIGGGATIVYLLFTTLTTYFVGIIIDRLNIRIKKIKEENAELKKRQIEKIKLRKTIFWTRRNL